MNSVARPTFQFSQTPSANIQRSTFDRSFGHKTTFNSGYLVPVLVDEVLPGDTFNCKMNVFARLSTPLFPTMDNCYLESFFFFVPNRLVWGDWEKFNGQQTNPGDSTSFTVPVQTLTGGAAAGSIYDYMGLPTVGGGGTYPPTVNNLTFNALHLRAYNLIWNEWFRDQNLQNSLTVDTSDGPDTTGYTLQYRGKRHDYFCSSLPWPQKTTAVNVLLQNSAVIQSNVAADSDGRTAWVTGYYNQNSQASPQAASGTGAMTTNSPPSPSATLAWPLSTDTNYDYANLTAANPTINQLRQSVQIQRMYEKDARGGTRYTEIIRQHFGVISPDARLQRPEFLGGGSSPVNIHPVAQTSASGITGSGTDIGSLSAFGVASGGRHGFSKSFVEHGVIIGLINVRADQTYQQGMNKMWLRQTRFDFYWPTLAHLGEQTVTNGEIYYLNNTGGNIALNQAAFGYQERYAEYRYKPSMVTGEYRSNYTTPLDSWHYAYTFTSSPALNSTFIQAVDFIGRTLAVPTQPFFLCDMWFSMRCARPMPVHSVPGMMDRF